MQTDPPSVAIENIESVKLRVRLITLAMQGKRKRPTPPFPIPPIGSLANEPAGRAATSPYRAAEGFRDIDGTTNI
jgi:hypothetical protein